MKNKKVETRHKLRRNLKSQGMSINVIIIAAIALIILVVLVAVFTGRFGIFAGTVQDCAAQGGQCTTSSACQTGISSGTHMGSVGGTGCDKTEGQTCCINIK